MKRTLIALFATAALAIPAVAQQQDPNQNTDQNTSQNQNRWPGPRRQRQNTPDPSRQKGRSVWFNPSHPRPDPHAAAGLE